VNDDRLFAELEGTRISRIGLGCSNFGKRCDGAAAAAIVGAALDAGINFFDVADVYGEGTAESLLGRGLAGRRDEAVVATKFGHATKDARDPSERGGHPKNVTRSADASLRALGTDRIDLLQLHEPDPDVPVAETLGALQTLVDQGKVRWVGCSNVSLAQVEEAHAAADERGVRPFDTVQNEYSLLVRGAEADLLPYCRRNGMRFIPYFPLASGVLTGKYRLDQRVPEGSRVARMKPDKLFRFFTPRALDLVERLVEIGDESGRSVLELALGFHLAEPAVLSVIAGAMSPGQVRANATAARAAAELRPDEVELLRSL
jgi:aryl-alcohol dehydrogenase-like predicted oxidoreductase